MAAIFLSRLAHFALREIDGIFPLPHLARHWGASLPGSTGTIRSLLALLTLASVAPVQAQSVAGFYEGKRISLIIGAGEGAAYDLAARLIARRLRAHIPGAPTIVPQNMPGASQIRATEYAFNIAPRDGTTLLIAQPSVVLNRILNPAARYDVQAFGWIGRVQATVGLGIVSAQSPIRTFADVKEREVVMGANSPNGPQSMLPTALNTFTGAKFKVVRGYESEHRMMLALERGEIAGIGNVMSDPLLTPQGLITQRLARPLYAASLRRLERLPEVPTIVELVTGEEDRAVMRLMAAISDLGLNLMASPGIPPDRVEALRRAFDAMLADGAFRDELGKLGFAVDGMRGEELARFIAENFAPPPELVTRMKAAALME